jgi:hypothetical protein
VKGGSSFLKYYRGSLGRALIDLFPDLPLRKEGFVGWMRKGAIVLVATIVNKDDFCRKVENYCQPSQIL